MMRFLWNRGGSWSGKSPAGGTHDTLGIWIEDEVYVSRLIFVKFP